MKPWWIAQRMLRQNRWLSLFFILWPFLMASMLLLSGGVSGPEDVLSVLRQECFYGLALVAFTGSVQLGNEQRSRRVASVLSRSISRREYLLGLLYAGCIPLFLYVLSFLLSAQLLLGRSRSMTGVARGMAPALLLLGICTVGLSLFFATWLPSWLASMATLASVSASFLLEQAGRPGVGHLWRSLLQNAARANSFQFVNGWDLLIAVIATAALFEAGAAIFGRRDLNLKAS